MENFERILTGRLGLQQEQQRLLKIEGRPSMEMTLYDQLLYVLDIVTEIAKLLLQMEDPAPCLLEAASIVHGTSFRAPLNRGRAEDMGRRPTLIKTCDGEETYRAASA